MHIFQTDDPAGEAHYPRGEVPPHLDEEEIKVTGKQEVDVDYPTDVDLSKEMYLDTYTGKAYKGRRGLMVHLGQRAGKDNIPADVTDKHEADDFPIVEVDDAGNITEVLKWPDGSVPPVEPYLPWYDDETEGYVSRQQVREFVEEVKEGSGAATAEAIEEALLKN
jgi:hypothetical protein